MNYLTMQKNRTLAKQSDAKNTERKASTRTKIQLGGLLIKAGIVEDLDIELGEDLQMESASLEKAELLLGLLLAARENYHSLKLADPDEIEKCKLKGHMKLKYDTYLQG